MQCPACSSDNVQKLSVLYENGTSDIQTSSTTIGAGLGRTGRFGSAQTTTTGQSQSKLALKAAPPAKKSQKSLILIGIGLFLFANTTQAQLLVFAVALVAGGGFLFYQSYKYNNDVWPGLYENWRKLWHCNKCGTIYSY